MKPLFTSIALIPNNPTKLATIEFLNFEWFQLKKMKLDGKMSKSKLGRTVKLALSNWLDVCGSSIKHGYYH